MYWEVLTMKIIGLIGLGRMGYNLALNMMDKDIVVIAYDKFLTDEVKNNKALKTLPTIKDLVDSLPKPRLR